MRINYNVSSIIASNALNNNDNALSSSIQKLSSGLKINAAKDDSAGLAVSLKMNAQIKSLEQAENNANDGISVVNTADGAMSEMHDILQRMNELAIQSANGTNADSDREMIQLEIDQLVDELDRISETTEFNAQTLLDGSFAYKAYTNTENIKALSYTEGVTTGTYAIKQIAFEYYEDTIEDYATYIDGDASGETKEETHFNAVDADAIKAALVTTDQRGLNAFPEGSRVVLEDENIYIEAGNNFEIKLEINDKTPIQGTATTTIAKEYITTDSYNNVTVTDASGSKKYNISNITKAVTKDANGIVTSTSYYSGSVDTGYRALDDDLYEAYHEAFSDAKTVATTDCSFSTTTVSKTYVSTEGVTTTYDFCETTLNLSVYVTREDGTSYNDTLSMKVYMPLSSEYEEKIQEKLKEDSSTTYEELYDIYYPMYESDLPDKVKENTINNYLDTHTETVKSTYTVGDEDDPVLINVTGKGAMRLQIGANEGQVISIEIPDLSSKTFNLDGLDISTEDKATEAIDDIGEAINRLSKIRAKIGAYSNRIEHTITNLDTTIENMTAAYSRIMDVDMATEITNYSTQQVLVQSATSMLSQANERPQQVLQLLQ